MNGADTSRFRESNQARDGSTSDPAWESSVYIRRRVTLSQFGSDKVHLRERCLISIETHDKEVFMATCLAMPASLC